MSKKVSSRGAKVMAATVAGVSLLLGGSTYALWSSSTSPETSATIQTGDFQASSVGPGVWTDLTTSGSPRVISEISDYRMAPGDLVELRQDFNLLVPGGNTSAWLQVIVPDGGTDDAILSMAEFNLELIAPNGDPVEWGYGGSTAGELAELSYFDVPASAAGGDVYTVVLTVNLPYWADNDTKLSAAVLGDMVLSIYQDDVAAVAVDPYCLEDPARETFNWYQSGPESVSISGYNGPSGDLLIPDQLGPDCMPVEAISPYSFTGKGITSVSLPTTISTIAPGAFSDNNLTRLTIPSNVTTIGVSAFANNQIKTLIIPDTVTTIDPAAFRNNHLKSVTIPATITNLAPETFWGNQLRTVTIPASVTNIDGSVFRDNPNLTSVFFEGDAPTLNIATEEGRSLGPAAGKLIHHRSGATGFSNPWYGYTVVTY